MVSGTRKVLDTSATDHDYAMLLKVVSLTRNVACHLDAVGKTHSGNLAKCGIRFLRCRGTYDRADTALLRRAGLNRLVLSMALRDQRRLSNLLTKNLIL